MAWEERLSEDARAPHSAKYSTCVASIAELPDGGRNGGYNYFLGAQAHSLQKDVFQSRGVPVLSQMFEYAEDRSIERIASSLGGNDIMLDPGDISRAYCAVVEMRAEKAGLSGNAFGQYVRQEFRK
jgi:hypothetical protein